MSTKNSNANEPHRFGPTLQRKLDWKSLNKHFSPHDLSIYLVYMEKYRQKCNSIFKLQHRMMILNYLIAFS